MARFLTPSGLEDHFARRVPRVALLAVVMGIGGATWLACFAALPMGWAAFVANPFFIAMVGPLLSLRFATTWSTRAPGKPNGYPLCNDCAAPQREERASHRARQRYLVRGQCSRCHLATGGIGGLVYGGFAMGVFQLLAAVRWH